MTPEQKSLIQSELNDFRSRSQFKYSEKRLLMAESTITPYVVVKEWYDEYLTIGSLEVVANKLGMNSKRLRKKFDLYNLTTLRKFRKKTGPKVKTETQITQKHLDTLTMGFTEWKKKYNSQGGGSYYKSKKIALRSQKNLAE